MTINITRRILSLPYYQKNIILSCILNLNVLTLYIQGITMLGYYYEHTRNNTNSTIDPIMDTSNNLQAMEGPIMLTDIDIHKELTLAGSNNPIPYDQYVNTLHTHKKTHHISKYCDTEFNGLMQELNLNTRFNDVEFIQWLSKLDDPNYEDEGFFLIQHEDIYYRI